MSGEGTEILLVTVRNKLLVMIQMASLMRAAGTCFVKQSDVLDTLILGKDDTIRGGFATQVSALMRRFFQGVKRKTPNRTS